MAKERCCHIGGDDIPCQADAMFCILPGPGDDVYSDTYACTLHVGFLLSDNPNGHTVVPYKAEP